MGQSVEASLEGSRRDVAKELGMLSKRNLDIAEVVRRIAEQLERTPGQVALRWLLHQPGVTAPIPGARTVAHIEDNLGCLDFDLGPEDLAQLEVASTIDLGFPHDFMATAQYSAVVDGGTSTEGDLTGP